MTLEALYRCGRRELAEAGVDSPAFDAMALFTRRFGLDRQALLLHGEQEAEKEKTEAYLADVRELVSLQRRCANNLNQVAIHANTYGIYPSEIAALQKDYADLWGPLSVLIKKLSEVVEL